MKFDQNENTLFDSLKHFSSQVEMTTSKSKLVYFTVHFDQIPEVFKLMTVVMIINAYKFRKKKKP